MIAIIDQESQADASASGDSVRHVAQVAQLAGLRIVRISRAEDDADGFLWGVPMFDAPQPAIWVGFMMPPDHYKRLYDALCRHNIFLLNSPDEHIRAEEFDQFYPRISDLTPHSVVVSSVPVAEEVISAFSWPVFVKGTVQSLKVEGPRSCFAASRSELNGLASRLLAHQSRTRGRVIIREALALRHTQQTPAGLAAGREFRVFLLRNQVLASGYYWPMQDPLSKLSREETQAVHELAVLASKRLDVPFLAVDIAQLANLAWTVIEVGDAQFAGLCTIPPFKLINGLCSLDASHRNVR